MVTFLLQAVKQCDTRLVRFMVEKQTNKKKNEYVEIKR